MNTIELIKDIVLFGGNLPDERKQEVTDFIKKHETEPLTVANNRRELLIAYEKEVGSMDNLGVEESIDKYLRDLRDLSN